MIFCGIPGSGKTTIAALVARVLPAVHIQTDAIRFMIPKPSYTRHESRFVYESMFLVGREALKRGYDVILDGTFLREDYRGEALEKLSRYYSSASLVCVLCEPETARARNSSRPAAVPDESFERLVRSFERPRKAIVVDSGRRSPESSAGKVLRELARGKGAPSGGGAAR